MVKYLPKSISLYSDTAWSFGAGARIPVGEDSATRFGVDLAEDMQPSTGAYGGMVWTYWAEALNDSEGARLYASASHTRNGDNDRKYQFGDDTTITLGDAPCVEKSKRRTTVHNEVCVSAFFVLRFWWLRQTAKL